MALGEKAAVGLGHHPGRIRFLITFTVALLVGSATALAEPLIFVGLVVPFIAQAFSARISALSLAVCACWPCRGIGCRRGFPVDCRARRNASGGGYRPDWRSGAAGHCPGRPDAFAMTAGFAMPDKRNALVNTALLGLLILATIISLATGTVQFSLLDTLRALAGNADPITDFVINELRLSRVIAGLLSGAALAMAGCLMQTLARNRLATPGIIGIDNAATAFAVASVVGVGLSLAPSAMALAGAAAATAIAFGLAGANGTRGYRFIVAGIGIGAIAGAVTQVMLSRVAIDAANAAYPWTVGSLNARSGQSVLVLGMGLAAGYLVLMSLSRALNTLQFTDAVAIALGRD